MTTFDIVWQTFLLNCEMESIELPNTDDRIYQTIQNAILFFNNRFADNLKADELTETLNRELNDSHLLILAHYIKLAILKNKQIVYVTTWQPFQKEIGLKNYSYQVKYLSELIDKQAEDIESMILYQNEDFMS